jgi:peptidoglycan/LPS O-acetylase OafA/YrhL
MGFLGVPIFFVISGYCIYIAGKHVKTPVEFITRRLFRIFPPYWFSLLITGGCILAIKITTGVNDITPLPKDPGSIVATVFLYTSPISEIQTVNWVYWTLPYELAFYFLVFFSLLIIRKYRYTFLFILTGISLCLPKQVSGSLFFFNELPMFMLGYSLNMLLDGKEGRFCGALIFICSLLGIQMKHPDQLYFVFGLGTAILIALDYYKHLPDNYLSRLGDYSYSIYLIHVPLGVYLTDYINHATYLQRSIPLKMAYDIIILYIIIIVSKAIYTFIELPSISLGRRVSHKLIISR